MGRTSGNRPHGKAVPHLRVAAKRRDADTEAGRLMVSVRSIAAKGHAVRGQVAVSMRWRRSRARGPSARSHGGLGPDNRAAFTGQKRGNLMRRMVVTILAGRRPASWCRRRGCGLTVSMRSIAVPQGQRRPRRACRLTAPASSAWSNPGRLLLHGVRQAPQWARAARFGRIACPTTFGENTWRAWRQARGGVAWAGA
jgi:hypothetical protein